MKIEIFHDERVMWSGGSCVAERVKEPGSWSRIDFAPVLIIQGVELCKNDAMVFVDHSMHERRSSAARRLGMVIMEGCMRDCAASTPRMRDEADVKHKVDDMAKAIYRFINMKGGAYRNRGRDGSIEVLDAAAFLERP